MARKKQSPSLKPDVVRTIGLVCIVVLGAALAVMALAGFLRGMRASPFFKVRMVVIADNIQPVELPELAKLKGQNILAVDLAKAEAKVRAKYPQLADVRVMRQFPDKICVSGVRRTPFAKISIDGALSVIDRDGYMIGAPAEGQEGLTVIKGLKRQKIAAGSQVRDARIKLAVTAITLFQQDRVLASVGLGAVNVDDLTRIVCGVQAGEAHFEVIVDKDNMAARLKTLSEVLSRGGLDLMQIKYMDLRFGEPILGQKKAKK